MRSIIMKDSSAPALAPAVIGAAPSPRAAVAGLLLASNSLHAQL